MYEDRRETVQSARQWDIAVTLIADATSIDHRRVSDFMKFRPLPEDTANRIKEAVEKITFVWKVFGYRIIFSTPEKLDSAFRNAKDVSASRKDVLDDLDRELRETFQQTVAQTQ